jgi:hypothetical protein
MSEPDADSASQLEAAAENRSTRLRLKRIFLLSLVISLATCATVAVFALLRGKFDETTGRILGTLGALAFHSGVSMFCAFTLERRRWPELSLAGLVLFGISFAILTACIWLPGISDDYIARAILTTCALTGYYLLAIPCASLCERRRSIPLSLGGLGACIVGFLMLLVCIWAPHAENVLFGKATGIAGLVAFAFAHTGLLLHVRAVPSLSLLRKGCIACAWAVALWATRIILEEADDEFSFRLLGALGVVDACGSLALVILAKVKQVQKTEKLTSVEAQLEICCPRCTTRQVVAAGASKCGTCGLKFRIEIEEPRCAKCDYLLWQLPQRRCPECGTPF